MPLPKPIIKTYELKLPTSGKTITFRPFLVKEGKIGLQTAMSTDETEIFNVMKDMISACILEPTTLNIDNMPLHELEYIIMHIRGKSVGEDISLSYTCTFKKEGKTKPCSGLFEHFVNIDDINIQVDPNNKPLVELQDSLGIKLKYPTFSMLKKHAAFFAFAGSTNEQMTYDKLMDAIYDSTVYIYDQETTYESYTKEEFLAFIESLADSSLKKILDFFRTLPKLRYEIPFKCPNCKYEEKIVIERLADFFE